MVLRDCSVSRPISRQTTDLHWRWRGGEGRQAGARRTRGKARCRQGFPGCTARRVLRHQACPAGGQRVAILNRRPACPLATDSRTAAGPWPDPTRPTAGHRAPTPAQPLLCPQAVVICVFRSVTQHSLQPERGTDRIPINLANGTISTRESTRLRCGPPPRGT